MKGKQTLHNKFMLKTYVFFLFSLAEVNYGSDAVPGKQQELTRLLWQRWLRHFDRLKNTKSVAAAALKSSLKLH